MLNGKFSQECVFTLVGPFFLTAFVCQTASAQQQVNSSNDPSNSPDNNQINIKKELTSNFFSFFPPPSTYSKQIWIFCLFFFPPVLPMKHCYWHLPNRVHTGDGHIWISKYLSNEGFIFISEAERLLCCFVSWSHIGHYVGWSTY